ncbi:pentatricopeptide repeat-containing protein [Corchorus olitorius]|uniref:Pentatricopeptide repeat-containing protein n=1 Tax=Corchorus olitorius TaxID=93759 RepID=A0A1R3H3E8_9ROSI|nr:pentatricopeptide repeat-containing protein [Corchorus olitorius]
MPYSPAYGHQEPPYLSTSAASQSSPRTPPPLSLPTESGDFETALSICEESMKKDWFPTYSIMKSLVVGLASISKVDEAKELIQKVKNKFSKNQELWDEVEKALPLPQ